MAFVDEARIFVKAGGGGKGCESFHKDLYRRHAQPDGGDGGAGGSIICRADRSLQTLLDYRFKQHYKAGRGGHGSSKGKTGRRGEDAVLRVPLGTIIRDYESRMLMKELLEHDDQVIVAKGGLAGRGNMHKRKSAPPTAGEEFTIHLELKLIADVGLVGFPNAGKSTLVNAISKVKSKIASYHFTTRSPILGVVPGDDFDFIVADLPGLIEGAHTGKGLGDRFLKHSERTKVLVHVVDMAGSEGRDPYEDYQKICLELEQYSDQLSVKSRMIVANKMDLEDSAAYLKSFQDKVTAPVFPISAKNGEGLDDLINAMREAVSQAGLNAE